MKLSNLKYAPKLAFLTLAGLIYYTFLEAEMFLLGVTSVLFGWQLGWTWGLCIYLSVYLLWRMMGHWITVLSGPVRSRPEENVNE